jgi:hypothetical protein
MTVRARLALICFVTLICPLTPVPPSKPVIYMIDTTTGIGTTTTNTPTR